MAACSQHPCTSNSPASSHLTTLSFRACHAHARLEATSTTNLHRLSPRLLIQASPINEPPDTPS
eukprot:2487265-Pyramimonas_sp.AAC.1